MFRIGDASMGIKQNARKAVLLSALAVALAGHPLPDGITDTTTPPAIEQVEEWLNLNHDLGEHLSDLHSENEEHRQHGISLWEEVVRIGDHDKEQRQDY